MTAEIEFAGFTKIYRGRRAVDDVSFRVDRGRIVGLLGPNGAGKSTAMKGLVGLLRPSSGAALIRGRAFSAYPRPSRVIGVQMDGFGFEAGITARRHLQIAALAAGMRRARADEVLEEVGLAEASRRRVKTFSTGMAQRLGLASALVGRPEILLLDEPGNGLDPEGIRWLRRFLRAYAAHGGTVLISSHQLGELQQLIDEVVVLRQRVLHSGALSTLLGPTDRSLEERYFDLVESREPEEARP